MKIEPLKFLPITRRTFIWEFADKLYEMHAEIIKTLAKYGYATG